MKLLFSLLISSLLAATALAEPPTPPGLQSAAYIGTHYLVRTVDPKKEDLQIFLKDDQGNLIHTFSALDKYVASKGEKLVFACNAGMFQPDSTPVGLLVQNGNETTPINLNDGQGNFYMKPNGVFLINDKQEAMIVDSGDYAALLSPAVWATQSGPLLVHGGDLDPDFIETSPNKKIRNGVGIRKDGTIVLAISTDPVNFYRFGAFFIHEKCRDALFLDGEISGFYVPNGGLPSYPCGPMIGVVVRE